MLEASPSEAVGLVSGLAGVYGAVGSVLAICLAVALWGIKQLRDDIKELVTSQAATITKILDKHAADLEKKDTASKVERDELRAQIRECQQQRREDVTAQFAKIDTFVDKLVDASGETNSALQKLQYVLASKGLTSHGP